MCVHCQLYKFPGPLIGSAEIQVWQLYGTTWARMKSTTLASYHGGGPAKFVPAAAVVLALLAFYVGLIILGLAAIGPVPGTVVAAPEVAQPR